MYDAGMPRGNPGPGVSTPLRLATGRSRRSRFGARRLAIRALGRRRRDHPEPPAPAPAATAHECALPPKFADQAPTNRAGQASGRAGREVDLAFQHLVALRRLEFPRHGNARTRDLLDAPKPHFDLRLPARAHRLHAPAPLELEVGLGGLVFLILGLAAATPALALLGEPRVVIGIHAREIAIARLLAAATPALEAWLEHAVHPIDEIGPQEPRVIARQTALDRLIAPEDLTFHGNAVLELPGAAVFDFQEIEARA